MVGSSLCIVSVSFSSAIFMVGSSICIVSLSFSSTIFMVGSLIIIGSSKISLVPKSVIEFTKIIGLVDCALSFITVYELPSKIIPYDKVL